MTVIAESTPGPIAINCATFTGYKKAGIAGAFAATLGIVVPSFVVIYAISMFLDNFLELTMIVNAFKGIKIGVGFLSDEMLTYMIAVSESTPGPIMINLATYIGSSQAGFRGAVLATMAVAMPSFLIILLVTVLLKTVLKNKYVQAILRGMKPCVIGIVLATGIYMVITNCIDIGFGVKIQLSAVILTGLLAIVSVGHKYYWKKKISPILLIMISAIAGIVVYRI